MEVILLERVENLGFMGDIVNVRPGYARNYLLPQSKALRKSDANLRYFETQKAELEARNLKRRQDAEQVAERMAGLSIVLVRQASEGGQLYGSVSARDLADTLKDEGFTVGRSQVQLNAPLKALGTTEVRVSLHPEVVVAVTVTIARSLEDAERQAAAAQAAADAEAATEADDLVEDLDGAVDLDADGDAQDIEDVTDEPE
ncbi:50S ribosomal protein L9 [Roseospira visakhapatnamensis]|uniref:Large ribosomal subunit protein bL9 n=1 Tax=Roseospira visakhapatnamensis TaxID=390880 RepID=A0A7W6RB77_9PROT|nr:50S ribosomal protein L9 [Roseospira visakhapatnamensis]MBB4265313.1 large subunit ribosomal protein L9 [Roseospira visakhapatnamensis]